MLCLFCRPPPLPLPPLLLLSPLATPILIRPSVRAVNGGQVPRERAHGLQAPRRTGERARGEREREGESARERDPSKEETLLCCGVRDAATPAAIITEVASRCVFRCVCTGGERERERERDQARESESNY